MNCKFICLLALLLTIISHSSAVARDETRDTDEDPELNGLGFQLIKLLSQKSKEFRENYITDLQKLLSTFDSGEGQADATTTESVSVDTAQGAAVVSNISDTTTILPINTTTMLPINTTTTPPKKTPIITPKNTPIITPKKTPIITPTNTTTVPPTNITTIPLTATRQQTESVEPSIELTTAASTDKKEIAEDTQKFPFRTSHIEEHFYKSPFFFFLLFCSVISIFTVYFLYVSRRKLKTYFSKKFAPGRGVRAPYIRAPTLEDAMPSFSGVKE